MVFKNSIVSLSAMHWGKRTAASQDSGVGNGEAYALTHVSSISDVRSNPTRFMTANTVEDRLRIVGSNAGVFLPI